MLTGWYGRGMSNLPPGTATIAVETPDQPDVLALLRAADERSASLYPAGSRHGSSAETLLAHDASFFVVRLEGQAVGCGGLVAGDWGKGELKRIFVEGAARGHGLGRLILTTLEAAARKRNVQLIQLETGVKSVEAISLYWKSGYVERGPFGAYRPDPLSVFMEKLLS